MSKEPKDGGVRVLRDDVYPGGVGIKVTVERIDIEGEPHWLWEVCLKTDSTFHDHKSWVTVFDVATEEEIDEYANEQEITLN